MTLIPERFAQSNTSGCKVMSRDGSEGWGFRRLRAGVDVKIDQHMSDNRQVQFGDKIDAIGWRLVGQPHCLLKCTQGDWV